MKKALKITGRVLGGIGLLLYIVVALANYSLVQSYVGAKVGNYLTNEWGGTVRVGAIHASVFDHVILNDILLVSPTGDTIANGRRVSVSFRRFPWHGGGLEFKDVEVDDVYYHFAQPGKGQMNLRYIIDYYKQRRKKKEKTGEGTPFHLTADNLTLRGVHYKMDLKSKPRKYDVGVEIPHMEFFDIDAKFKDVVVADQGDVQCRIVHMRARERSGFVVKNMRMDVHVGPKGIHCKDMYIETGESCILADADLVWPGNDWRGISGYVSSVKQYLVLKEGTHASMRDVAYWAPSLWGNTLEANITGVAYGTVDSLCSEGLHVEWGEGARADLNCVLHGLPNVDTSYGHVELHGMHASVSDADQVLRNFVKRYKGLDDRLVAMEYIDLEAEVDGGYDRRRSPQSAIGAVAAILHINAQTGWGSAVLDATMHNRQVSVALQSPQLATKALVGEWVTSTGIDLTVQGHLPAQPSNWKAINANVQVSALHPVLRGVQVAGDIDLQATLREGVVKAEMQCADSALNVRLLAEADMHDSVPHAAIEANVQQVELSRFGFVADDATVNSCSGNLSASWNGFDPDQITGTLTASDLHVGPATIADLRATVEHPSNDKLITLESDLVDLRLGGHFNYADMGDMVRYFYRHYVPEMLQSPMADADTATLASMSVALGFTWKDASHQLEKLYPSLYVAPGTRFDGTYNFAEQLKLVLRSDGVKIGGVNLADIGVSGRGYGDRYVLHAECGQLAGGDNTLFEKFRVDLGSSFSKARARLAWGESESTTEGDLALVLADSMLAVEHSRLRLLDEEWQLSIGGSHLDRHSLLLQDFGLQNTRGSIVGAFRLLGDDRDHLLLDFDQFDLSTPSQLLLSESGFDLGGRVDGHFALYGLHQTPYFNAALAIDSCTVTGQELGRLDLKSSWNAELNIINLGVENRQVKAHGWVGLDESKELNINIRFDSLEMAMAAPILSSFTSRFEGRLHGQAMLGGTLHEPLLLGEAYVDGGALRVDATGVTYYFSDSIRLETGKVVFNNFRVIDPRGNLARIDGNVAYHGLKEIGLNLHLQTPNIMVLDKASGDSFYGTAMVQAEATVTGSPSDLQIGVRARTNQGSTISIPVDDRRQVKAQNYIEFYSAEESSQQEDEHADPTPKRQINIDADVSLTPDLQLIIPITFSEVDLTVKANGSGDVHLGLPVGGVADVKGSYELLSGSMSVLIISLIEKSFTIEPGSNLNFQGRLQDARFDISASHSTRVNLSTLTGSLSALDNTQKYLQVENIINVAGTVQEPTIGFDLRLPNADQSVSDEVFAYIDRTNERDMLNQTISLLVRGRFYNVSGIDEGASSGLSSGLSLVASTLSSAMSDMVQFVDVNVDYKAANDLTNEQLDVNLSRDWGRWTIESTLGYGGNSRNLETENSVGIPVIDAMLSYRINPLMYLFVYNRTNTNDYTRIDLPYKQGVGLRLSKDFDRFSDLFHSRKKTTGNKPAAIQNVDTIPAHNNP